ncbi:MAG: hypothetical protein Q7R76_04205 [Candidatus Woesearchaeota archaeon]|nr:hypothetical protein [Candidatus Woesearchaeota archaeon]
MQNKQETSKILMLSAHSVFPSVAKIRRRIFAFDEVIDGAAASPISLTVRFLPFPFMMLIDVHHLLPTTHHARQLRFSPQNI